MKKYIILGIILITVIVGILIYYNYNKELTIEQITKVNFDRIAYVRDETKELNLDDFVNNYKNATFKKTNKYHNSTVREYEIIAYDKEDKILFTIKIGNDYKIMTGENNSQTRYEKIN